MDENHCNIMVHQQQTMNPGLAYMYIYIYASIFVWGLVRMYWNYIYVY